MIESLPDDLRPEKYQSLVGVIDYIANEHSALPAFSCLGRTLSYAEIDDLSSRFASFLQSETELKIGDRIAIQLPNLLQFPIAFYGAVKAGLVVVNTNPLYTATEMAHQFKDSGVKAIVILEAFCDKLEKVLPETQISTIIVAKFGDLQNVIRRQILNLGAKYLKGAAPNHNLPNTYAFLQTVKGANNYIQDSSRGSGDDVALILYTGGTTGFAKGAMLSHNNLIANMMQLRSRCLLLIRDKVENIAAPLPLYHSYAFLLHCLAMPFSGNHNILITNPRDLNSLIKLLKRTRINGFVGINTLYSALLRHKGIKSVDFNKMKFCGAGGMPMSTSVAEEWEEVTGCEIIEGYGLTECSPVVAVNIPGKVKFGTVGPLVPETELRVVDDSGIDVPEGQRGELLIKGPQVMLGYWEEKGANLEAFSEDGWLKTGDYVEVGEEGFITIVDRKKDMILVSGFNVFPNEVEDWVNRHPEVLECAAIGVPSERTGEAIKLFVVTKNDEIPIEVLEAHCREGLTPYKIPRDFTFVDDLPKSIIGKILRRELRD